MDGNGSSSIRAGYYRQRRLPGEHAGLFQSDFQPRDELPSLSRVRVARFMPWPVCKHVYSIANEPGTYDGISAKAIVPGLPGMKFSIATKDRAEFDHGSQSEAVPEHHE